MKVVVLNGSTGADKDGSDALSERIAALLERRGSDVQAYTLRECKLAHCVGCFACWIESPGLCKTDDASQEIARAVVRADVAVIVTPITFGGFSSAAPASSGAVGWPWAAGSRSAVTSSRMLRERARPSRP